MTYVYKGIDSYINITKINKLGYKWGWENTLSIY